MTLKNTMKKIIVVGIILTVIICGFLTAKAFDSMSIWTGDIEESGFHSGVVRIYDSENDILCYVYESGNTNNGGISCIKK